MSKLGIEFSNTPDKFSVTYNSPTRKIGNLREEFNNDALSISKAEGPVYIAFSSGIDSQIIVRCFLDLKLDAEFVFLHMVGHNEQEYQQILECEKFFNISVRKIEVRPEEYKSAWLKDNEKNKIDSISHYPFLYLSSKLEEAWPVITQGKAEPALVGTSKTKMSIYHNYYESMELRFSLMGRHRKIYDFPYSSEAITSYYTDNNMKTFASNIKYFAGNNLKFNNHFIEYTQYYNSYAKPFVKGQYFKDDVIWFPKLTGTEQHPEWLAGLGHSKNTRVSVPYWDLVNFLENNLNESKTYSDWFYGDTAPYPISSPV